jgi:hypothetical protein
MWIVAALFALVPPGDAAGRQAPPAQRLTHEAAGISIVMPAGWVRLQARRAEEPGAPAPAAADRSAVMAQLAHGDDPVFFFVQDVRAHPAETARVAVRVLSLPVAPEQAVDSLIATLNGQRDSMLVGPADRTEVSGMTAARAAMRQPGGGAPHDILSRAWFVPRGAFMIMIEMAAPEPTAGDFTGLFAEVLSSIRIEP